MNIVEVIYLINQCKENQNIDRIWKKQQTKHDTHTDNYNTLSRDKNF